MSGRGYVGDGGFGSPHGEDDDGFGSPGLDDAGFGSPFAFDLAQVTIAPPDRGVAVAPLARSTAHAIGEEGGYLLEARSVLAVFDERDGYRVDLIDEDGITHPDTEPGAYSAIEDQGTSCRAVAGGRVVRFASPPLDLGVYSVRITHPAGYELTVPEAFAIWREPASLEVDAIRAALPTEVYTKKGGPPVLPED